jgi:hypothetical protein
MDGGRRLAVLRAVLKGAVAVVGLFRKRSEVECRYRRGISRDAGRSNEEGAIGVMGSIGYHKKSRQRWKVRKCPTGALKSTF